MSCPVCNSIKSDNIKLFDEHYIKAYVISVSHGTINYEHLDLKLHEIVCKEFQKNIELGFGETEPDNEDLLFNLINSAYIFSAAKQYQLVRELLSLKTTSQEKYLEIAESLFIKYYSNYLTIELDSALYQAKSAKRFYLDALKNG